MKFRLKNKIRLTFFLLLIISGNALVAQQIPDPENPAVLVNDRANVLSADQVRSLENKLVAYDDSTSNQIVVLIIKSLNNYPIEEYALQVFRSWGIGNKETNNGVLIVAAIDDREIRIETGYGLEGAIPDITANQIIRNDIAPAFRAGNYYEGFDKATNSIILAAAGEYQAPEGYGNRGNNSPFPIGMFIVIFIIIFLLVAKNKGGGGGYGSRRGYRDNIPPIFFPGSFGGGSSGGGFSGGGGFGGFGGGMSGGGGASGSW